MKAKKAHRGGKQHNLIRGSHHDDTKKYEKQKVRTSLNKAKHILEAKALKKAADERRAAKAGPAGEVLHEVRSSVGADRS